jgi:hypothetical protein
MHIKRHSELRSARLLIWILALAIHASLGATPAPFAKVRPLELDATHWTSGFWANHCNTCRPQTIPGMWRLMSGTNHSHYLENVRVAAGLKEGRDDSVVTARLLNP